jgi:hypothetical protein
MASGATAGIAATSGLAAPELFAVAVGAGLVEEAFAGAGLAVGLDGVPLGEGAGCLAALDDGAGCLAALVVVTLAGALEFPALPVEPLEGV